MAEQVSDGWSAPVVPLPPFGLAPGPLLDEAAVFAAFAGGQPAGHSRRLHVEGAALLVDGDVAAGLRLSPDVVLVRADLPEEVYDICSRLESALEAEGMVRLDEASLLALPVALQVLGLRLSSWDLWGRDLDEAFAALRRAAIGDQESPAPNSRGSGDGYHQ